MLSRRAISLLIKPPTHGARVRLLLASGGPILRLVLFVQIQGDVFQRWHLNSSQPVVATVCLFLSIFRF